MYNNNVTSIRKHDIKSKPKMKEYLKNNENSVDISTELLHRYLMLYYEQKDMLKSQLKILYITCSWYSYKYMMKLNKKMKKTIL